MEAGKAVENINTTWCNYEIAFRFVQINMDNSHCACTYTVRTTPSLISSPARNYRLYTNGNQVEYFSYPGNSKILRVVYPYFINGIAVSARYGSSTSVVQNTGLNEQQRQIKESIKEEGNQKK